MAAVVLVAGALAGCGGSSSDEAGGTTSGPRPASAGPTMLDTRKVERAIAASVREQRDVAAKVQCPRGVRQAKDVNFVCRATSKFGVTEFAVVQRDAAGRVSYSAADRAP